MAHARVATRPKSTEISLEFLHSQKEDLEGGQFCPQPATAGAGGSLRETRRVRNWFRIVAVASNGSRPSAQWWRDSTPRRSVVPDPVPTTVGRQARGLFLPIPFRRVPFIHDLAGAGSQEQANP